MSDKKVKMAEFMQVLPVGEENAIRGRDIANMLGVDIRIVSHLAEEARRSGAMVCATSRGIAAGYYLAADADEAEAYCSRLGRRAAEMQKTRRIMLENLEKTTGKKYTKGKKKNGFT